MNLPTDKIVRILIERDYIDESDLTGFGSSDESSQLDYLIHKGVLNTNLLGQALAEHYGVPYLNLETSSPTKTDVLLIPEKEAKMHRIVIAGEDAEKIILATDDPVSAKTTPLSAPYLKGKKVELRYSAPESIERLFKYYEKDLDSRLTQIIENSELSAPQLLEAIIHEAIALKTSDIHFDPNPKSISLRFRIDGQLQDLATIPKDRYESLLNKVKVDAKLRIDQHDAALDGAIRFPVDSSNVDLRVSIIPTIDGEKTAIRVLKRYVNTLTFETLGINRKNQEILDKAIKSPYGMIVVTGPTGSGKTTSLYSLIKRLNKRNVNITTIEDPVEYRIKGVNQIQVNSETDITFAKGLRSIVRQDPDVIFVGEVRDLETAEIAINSALTGHLLLTSFHANSASAAIPRFIDMGVEPFLLASTLQIVIAQRLVRKLCEGCRFSQSLSQDQLKQYIDNPEKAFGPGEATLYFSKGCEACNNTGYKGRIGIYEVIEVNKELKELISRSPTADQIWELASRYNNPSLFDDGIEKVKAGITSLDEVARVAGRG